jgi:hypothetical protein
MSGIHEIRSFPFLRRALHGAFLLFCASATLAFCQTKLLPAPREAHFAGETAVLSAIKVSVPAPNAEDEFAAHDLQEAITGAGIKNQVTNGAAKAVYQVVLLRTTSPAAKALLAAHSQSFEPAMEPEGYILLIASNRASIVASTASGIFYGVQTLKQLLPLPGAKRVLPLGTIRDWPAMKYRGIDDDLSRGPFPTLEFQKHQIRVFASFKINIYSPYFEHTLLYADQPLPAPPGSSLTPAEIAELVTYAAKYHIDIIPEQEAFGHLHHVLKYDLYDDLAETPHGHVLAPGQAGTLPLIKDWFTQIAHEFPSPFMHVGADETLDLGRGLTQAEVKARGYGPVYVDFMKQIHDELAPLHRRLLFWGDIGEDDPKAVPGLPKDMIAVPWNYRKTGDFDSMIVPFTKAGIETWVAPGDANWKEVYPVAKVAFGNIQGFIRDGQRLGATGALTTVWNDDGEGLFNADWYSLMFGAVAAWQPGESSISAYQDAFGQIFHADLSGKIGEAEKEIMAAHDALARSGIRHESDEIFWTDPWSPRGQALSVKLLPVAKELRRHAERAIILVAQARAANPALKETDALVAMDLGARRLDLIGMQYQLAQEIVETYAQAVAQQNDKALRKETRNTLQEISSMFGRCQDLRDAYSASKAEYSQVWLSENRPYALNNVLLRFDLAATRWERRGDQFHDATRDWEEGKQLPPTTTLEMPATSSK